MDGIDGFLITPTGIAYDATTPDDIVAMTIDGTARGDRLPSSEWRFHRDLYRARDDVRRDRSRACAVRDDARVPSSRHSGVPLHGRDRGRPRHPLRAVRDVRLGRLAAHVVAAMAGRRACLLANHGMIAAGADLASALALAIEVEGLAEMYWRALQLGEPGFFPTPKWTWSWPNSAPTGNPIPVDVRLRSSAPRMRLYRTACPAYASGLLAVALPPRAASDTGRHVGPREKSTGSPRRRGQPASDSASKPCAASRYDAGICCWHETGTGDRSCGWHAVCRETLPAEGGKNENFEFDQASGRARRRFGLAMGRAADRIRPPRKSFRQPLGGSGPARRDRRCRSRGGFRFSTSSTPAAPAMNGSTRSSGATAR